MPPKARNVNLAQEQRYQRKEGINRAKDYLKNNKQVPVINDVPSTAAFERLRHKWNTLSKTQKIAVCLGLAALSTATAVALYHIFTIAFSSGARAPSNVPRADFTASIHACHGDHKGVKINNRKKGTVRVARDTKGEHNIIISTHQRSEEEKHTLGEYEALPQKLIDSVTRKRDGIFNPLIDQTGSNASMLRSTVQALSGMYSELEMAKKTKATQCGGSAVISMGRIIANSLVNGTKMPIMLQLGMRPTHLAEIQNSFELQKEIKQNSGLANATIFYTNHDTLLLLEDTENNRQEVMALIKKLHKSSKTAYISDRLSALNPYVCDIWSQEQHFLNDSKKTDPASLLLEANTEVNVVRVIYPHILADTHSAVKAAVDAVFYTKDHELKQIWRDNLPPKLQQPGEADQHASTSQATGTKMIAN